MADLLLAYVLGVATLPAMVALWALSLRVTWAWFVRLGGPGDDVSGPTQTRRLRGRYGFYVGTYRNWSGWGSTFVAIGRRGWFSEERTVSRFGITIGRRSDRLGLLPAVDPQDT